jgi:hypothetical protein
VGLWFKLGKSIGEGSTWNCVHTLNFANRLF